MHDYVTNTFLLASSSVRSKQLLCFVQGQGQKSEQKHTTKSIDEFHNHSPLLTMHELNRPYSYSRYWTGTSLEWRLMLGNIIKKREMSFVFEKTPRMSLTCKLVPVQYREHEYGLFFEFDSAHVKYGVGTGPD